MRKHLALLLVIASVLSLFGCKKEIIKSDTPTTTEPTEPIESEPTIPELSTDITQRPLYTLSLIPVTNITKASNGTIIFKEIYQTPTLLLPEPGVANKVQLDLMNRLDNDAQAIAAAVTEANNAYTGSAEWSPHLMQIKYEPQRLDPGILSLYGARVTYSGGAHAAYTGESVSYDLLTGNVVTLSDILCNGTTYKTIVNLVNNSLSAIRTNTQLFNDYEILVSEILGNDLQKVKNWYFNNQGLCFYFNPYDIAPFSSGTITATIPYSSLVGILEDAYFPAEKDNVKGTVNVVRFTDTALQTFNQYSELILDKNGTTFLVYTDTAVSDFRVYISNEPSTGEKDLVFTAYTLTPGDAITISANFTVREIFIRYESGGETTENTINLSGNTVTIQ